MRERTVYCFLHILLLSVLALGYWGKLIGIETAGLSVLLCLAAVSVLATAMLCMRARGRIIVCVGIVILACTAAGIVGWDIVLEFWRGYVLWAQNVGAPQGQYELVHAVWLGVGCAALQYLLEKRILFQAALAFTFTGFLLYFLVTETPFSKGYVILTALYLVMVAVEGLRQTKRSVHNGTRQAYVFWLLPFLALYVCVMLFMPVPEKAYDWQLVKTLYAQVQESWHKLAQNIRSSRGGSYAFVYSGFSQEARLGNGFVEEDDEVMSIESRSGLKTNVYLTGKIYDTFDGQQWLQTDESDETERYIDTVETLYATGRYDRGYQRDYLSRVTLHIRYRDFRSEYVFAPLKTWSLEQEGEKLAFSASGDSLLFPEKRGYGTEYEAIFYQMNINHVRFHAFLDAETEEDEQLLEELLQSINSRTKSALTPQDIREHSERVHGLYGEPVQLSAEAAAYVEQITAGADNALEKLQAIERELNSYTYTQSPPPMSEQVTDAESFLDYFLLESREGYCVHFATAFVLLARAEGIPARYVQGFCVPMKEQGETLVYAYMAHAWPEVYIEGKGWIPYEPTPGFARLRYTPWAVSRRQAEDANVSIEYAADEHVPDIERLVEESRERAEETTGDSTDVYSASALAQLESLGRIALAALGVFGASCLIAFVILRALGRYRYGKKDIEGKYAEKIAQNLWLMEALGAGRREEETLEEWQRRVKDNPIPAGTLTFLAHYEILRYGGGTADESNLAETLEAQKELLQLLGQTSKARYWYYICMRS